jgi:hypothetical protein
MLQRAWFLLFLCSYNGCLVNGCFINGNGQAQGDARDNGSGNASGNGSGNGVNVGSNPETRPGDGAWDITTAGGGAISPSEMVISGSRATGFIASKNEGTQDSSTFGCTRIKDRSEFQLDATGDTVRGTFSVVREWSGSSCPPNQKRTIVLTGARTTPGKNDLDGDWDVTAADKETFTAALHVSTTSGTMSATSTRTELSFAARKR